MFISLKIITRHGDVKGIRGVQLDNRLVLHSLGPGIKYYERFFLSLFKLV